MHRVDRVSFLFGCRVCCVQDLGLTAFKALGARANEVVSGLCVEDLRFSLGLPF